RPLARRLRQRKRLLLLAISGRIAPIFSRLRGRIWRAGEAAMKVASYRFPVSGNWKPETGNHDQSDRLRSVGDADHQLEQGDRHAQAPSSAGNGGHSFGHTTIARE